MQQRVLVVSHTRQQLMPCTPARARMLLKDKKAAVLRKYPFTIILKDRTAGDLQPIEFKTDPGSKVTGIALVADYAKRGKTVVFAVELQHRGQSIKNALDSRRAIRRSRRNRKTRYRAARFDNRTRPSGWLPPSLLSRVHNVTTWAKRLQRFAPLSSVAVETVRFDTQIMANPEISGIEYQQGELQGYEVREYLLEKWNRKCAYCGKKDVPLEIEHIIPRTRGGSNRVSNLTLSCIPCNLKKGTRTAEEFGHPEIQAKAQKPLKDAAAVNATRYAIGDSLKTLALPVSFWTGGRTKFNRTRQGYPKSHWIDAACVGEAGSQVRLDPLMALLQVKASGHGSRQMCRVDKYGFPRSAAKTVKELSGFRTGDVVRLDMPSGKYKGRHVGTVSVRARGDFDINTILLGKRCKITARSVHFRKLHGCDGYAYC